MKTPLITFVIGAACGALGMFLANSGGGDPVAEETKKPQLSALGSDSDAKKIARLEQRILELESMGSSGEADVLAHLDEDQQTSEEKKSPTASKRHRMRLWQECWTRRSCWSSSRRP